MTRPEIPEMFDEMPPADLTHLSYKHPETAPGPELLAGGQKVYLQDNESGKFININSNKYAVLEDDKKTQYVLVQYYQNHYIVIANGDYKDWFLSYSCLSYVGAYAWWINARYWAVDPVDCSPYPGLYVTGSSVKYVCCNGVEDKKLDELLTVVAY